MKLNLLKRILIQQLMSFALFAISLAMQPLEAKTIVSDKAMALTFPDTQSEVVAILEPNQEVDILQKTSEWALIAFEQGNQTRKAWVKLNQLRTEKKKDQDVEDDALLRSSDPANNFLFPTALSNRKGSKLVKGAGLGIWSFDYSLTDSTTVGARTVLPVGFVGIGPRIKQTFSVTDDFHFGVSGEVGGLASLWSYRNSNTVIYYLGGAMMTVGNSERALTVGSYVMGGGSSQERYSAYGEDDSEFVHGGLVMLNANAFYRVNEHFKVMVDAMVPATSFSSGSNHDSIGFEWGAVTYGARIGGELVSGDIGFSIPISDDTDDIMKRVPLGIPYISLNFAF